MAGQWANVDLSAKLFLNVEEAVLRKSHAAIENAFINEAGGHSRFPGLKDFVSIPGNAPVYLHPWKTHDGDLIAVSNSRVYRISKSGVLSDVTEVTVSGGSRVIFDETDEELVMAAGGQIVRLAAQKTEILSDDAPLATHVGYIDGFLMANEVHSGRFQHSTPPDFRAWNDLDTFAADGKPDEINAILVTPYREVLITGIKSVEQFERLPNGEVPFFRRWSVGTGIVAPYTLVAADQGTFGINDNYEFVRFTGQVSEARGDDIQYSLEKISDWSDAWATELQIKGQKFILLQIPNAMNLYGTPGITALYDYRQKKWSSLYGFSGGVPVRWPGWSYAEIWTRRFVGGTGRIYEFDTDRFDNAGEPQRMLGRTAPLDQWAPAFIDGVRMRIKRGVGTSDDPEVAAPQIAFRCIRDGGIATKWKYKSLGRPGDTHNLIEFGAMGHHDSTVQFEWMVTDPVSVEVVKLEVQVRRT